MCNINAAYKNNSPLLSFCTVPLAVYSSIYCNESSLLYTTFGFRTMQMFLNLPLPRENGKRLLVHNVTPPVHAHTYVCSADDNVWTEARGKNSKLTAAATLVSACRDLRTTDEGKKLQIYCFENWKRKMFNVVRLQQVKIPDHPSVSVQLSTNPVGVSLGGRIESSERYKTSYRYTRKVQDDRLWFRAHIPVIIGRRQRIYNDTHTAHR